ncbi:acyltransferase family protein [Chitiniphilus eburneus]|uniref:Acyltransferase n=1 Tax=Chitiniphilus eburneus TaxID=2571148 RepID=A0A4U0QA59_9NEIS|nr:acyltransferase family protein [Chitiniphilus eburneus]TJZ77282.1 acyltransferase [Chitiniphilus eburneus]
MTKRLAYLDILRVICVGLVMYGHYVLVGGGATSIPNIIAPGVSLPLIDASQWRAYVFEIFLIEHFSTQSAILGVSLFFLITGYLMPMMCERYGRVEFLVNRFFRIFPTLAASLALLGLFLYFAQGLIFPASQYLSSLSLLFFYIPIGSVSTVLWTLAIECTFYIIAAMIGRFSLTRLVFVQGCLLAIILAGVKYPENHYLWIMAWQARFLLMISIGSTIFLAERASGLAEKIQTIFPSIFISVLGFQIFKSTKVDPSTYETVGTHLLAVSIFILFWVIGPKLVKRTPGFIKLLSEMVYPLYLVHAAIGLATMAVLRSTVSNPYLLLASAVIASIFFAGILHIIAERPGIAFGRKAVNRIAGRSYFPWAKAGTLRSVVGTVAAQKDPA